MLPRFRRYLQNRPRTCLNYVYQGHTNLVSRLNPNEIRLLNWNIAKGEKHGWYADLRRLSSDKDIVMIQEAALDANLYDALLDKNHWSFSPGYNQKKYPTGVLTVTQAKPLNSHSFRHVEPLLRTPKATLVTEYGLLNSKYTLLVANIHAVNFTIGTKIFTEQLDAVFQVMKHHDGPTLFCGDFNTWRKKRVKRLYEIISELNLQVLSFETDRRKHSFGLPLDHILYSGLEAQQAQTLSVTSSDHNPMSVIFRVT